MDKKKKKKVVNLLSDMCFFNFLEAFLHQKSFDIDILGFSVFFPLTSIQ